MFSNTVNLDKSNHSKSEVVARLTVTRTDGRKTIVEVSADASFHSFYRYFRQEGNRRRTKQLIRVSNRNEGIPLPSAREMPGLDLILKRLMKYQGESNPIVSHRLRIIKKRAYRKLLRARPDELGLVKTRSNIPLESWRRERAIPVQIFETVQQ
jgi:hypothetical protein